MDEFADLEKELNVHNRDGRPGFPVKEGAFKGWRAFGAHPFSPDEKKNVIREFLDSEVGLLGMFLAILLGIYFTFAVVLTILHPVMWVVGILAFIFSSFNNLMIRFGWFKLAKCHGKYILWDGKNVFALPLKYGKNLVFTSKDIATITVEYGHSETVRVRNRNKGNANINFRVGLFSSMSDDTADHVDIDKQEFVKILASATGLEPIMKHIYRGS
jgi:hypothetical protein